METQFYVKQGLVQKVKSTEKNAWLGGFNLNRWFKWMAEKNNIPFANPCCLEDLERTPISYNVGDSGLEFLDPTTGDWTTLPPAATGEFTEIVTNAIGSDDQTFINVTSALVQSRDSYAANATATLTAAQLSTGYITSTSAAATSLTLPDASTLATYLNTGVNGSFEFIIDNTAGANTVTLILGSGMSAATPVVTGGATLTVSVANGIGIFRIVFGTTSPARVFRIG